jgi:cyclophilin family peptidyl-prolyl cis-trans isomerase
VKARWLVALATAAACHHAAPAAETAAPPLAEAEPDVSCAAVVQHQIDVYLTVDPSMEKQLADEKADAVAECEQGDIPVEIRTCWMKVEEVAGFDACLADYRTAHQPPLRDGLRRPTREDLAAFTSDLPGSGALTATISTDYGAIHCTLAEADAPITVANFVGLARGLLPWVDPATDQVVNGKPFFDGLTFHRVIPGFMIQGGDPIGNGSGGPGYEFADEIVASLGFDKPGVMAMANAGPDTNGSQFFITEEPRDDLTGSYSVFGQCDDADVVKAIAEVETGANDKPYTPVVMKKVTISRGD